MAYDTESDRAILFGGLVEATFMNDTWAYDHNRKSWTNLNPLTGPVGRESAAMAYDAESDRIILFGGFNGALTGDTWAYDLNNNTWTNMTPAAAPSARSAAMAYDTKSDRVILVGGSGSSALDTWSYDFNANTWTDMAPTIAPSARYRHAVSYDVGSDRVILFGGAFFGASGPAYLDDTWSYDFNTNAWTQAEPVGRPSARDNHAMAYDAQSDRVILFGGFNYDGTILDDTWAYDFNTATWTKTEPYPRPSGRFYGHAMAYDAESDRIILFGGLGAFGTGDETWAYDLNANRWTTSAPLGRGAHAMAYDTESDRVILFGGATGYAAVNDTWAYDFNNKIWTEMTPTVTPPPRFAHGMAYDIKSDRVILFGGAFPFEPRGDTWAYDFNNNTWRDMTPVGSPSQRAYHAMAYDAESDRVILFGGYVSGELSNETWAYDFDNNKWTNMEPATRPPLREWGYALAYDAESDRIILFGGFNGYGTFLNDTWAYDFNNNTWTQMEPVGAPAARDWYAMAYDVESDVVVMFGGYNGKLLNDTWTYDFNGNAWMNISVPDSPPPRNGQSMAYDTESDRIVLFGGVDIANRVDDETWAYRQTLSGPPGAPQGFLANAGDGQIMLAWTPPADDGGAPVTSYRLYRGTDSGNLSFLIELGYVLGYTDSNLTNGVAYYYQVSALNAFGEGPRSMQVRATPRPPNQPPVASFTFSPAAPLEGDLVAFEDTSSDRDGSGDILTWQWDFGDGGTSSERNPAHTFSANNTYAIRLTVTDSVGHTNSTAAHVEVADKDPAPNFVFDPATPREGEAVAFFDISASYDGIVRRSWDFGDGSNGTEQNVTHTYQTDGALVVTLTVFEADGDQASQAQTVVVGAIGPIADFSWTPLNPEEGAMVGFTDGSVSYDGIVAWEWDLDGDGFVDATVPAPTFIYPSDGVFSATLTVREADGDFSTVRKNVTVSDISPIAAFAFEPASPEEGALISFQDASFSYDRIASWQWDFGDRTTSPLQNPTHVYDHDGTFLVTFTVSEADGDMNTTSTVITVLDANPFSAFAWIPGVPTEGAAVEFQDLSATHDGIVGWSWDFGDGTGAGSPNPSHVYTSDGTFTVNLTVREGDGDVSTVVRSLAVADVDPKAAFSFSPLNPLEGNAITFTESSSSSDGIVSWSWDFGDGTTGTQRNPTHAYDNDGTFTVHLIVREADGDVSTSSAQLTVNDSDPVADFDYSPTAPRAGDPVSFTDRSISHDGIVAWEWDFGDGSTSSLQNPSHVFGAAGSFTVTLTVREADGDAVVTSKAVVVAQGGFRPSGAEYFFVGGAAVVIGAVVAVLVMLRRKSQRP